MTKTKSKSQDLKFSKDELGKDVLLKDENLQVMMEWEKPYMEACIEMLKPSGDVLEIGFGLGYSATAIQKHQPKSHTIIECDPTVIEEAKKWAKKHKNVKILEGRWQDLLPKLEQFDAIFFDDYSPLSQGDVATLKKNVEQYQQLSDETDALREAIGETLKQFRNIKFSDDDLKKFTAHIKSRATISNEQVIQFIDKLVDQGNITQKQKDAFLKTLPKQSKEADSSQTGLDWLNKKKVGDRFISFAEECLNKHMRPKAHLSAYMDSPESNKEHKEFQDKILSRKDVKYSEKVIPVKVPANCTYFQGDKALVMLLEKR